MLLPHANHPKEGKEHNHRARVNFKKSLTTTTDNQIPSHHPTYPRLSVKSDLQFDTKLPETFRLPARTLVSKEMLPNFCSYV